MVEYLPQSSSECFTHNTLLHVHKNSLHCYSETFPQEEPNQLAALKRGDLSSFLHSCFHPVCASLQYHRVRPGHQCPDFPVPFTLTVLHATHRALIFPVPYYSRFNSPWQSHSILYSTHPGLQCSDFPSPIPNWYVCHGCTVSETAEPSHWSLIGSGRKGEGGGQ